MAILLFMLLVVVLFQASQIFRFPVGAIFRHGRLELADLLGNRFQFQFKSGIDVDKIIGFVGRRIEEIKIGDGVGLQFIHEQMFGIIEMKLRGAHGVDGVEGRHAMIGLVPPLVPLAGIDCENRIRAILPNDFSDLTT